MTPPKENLIFITRFLIILIWSCWELSHYKTGRKVVIIYQKDIGELDFMPCHSLMDESVKIVCFKVERHLICVNWKHVVSANTKENDRKKRERKWSMSLISTYLPAYLRLSPRWSYVTVYNGTERRALVYKYLQLLLQRHLHCPTKISPQFQHLLVGGFIILAIL